jgi:hypothetical protein
MCLPRPCYARQQDPHHPNSTADDDIDNVGAPAVDKVGRTGRKTRARNDEWMGVSKVSLSSLRHDSFRHPWNVIVAQVRRIPELTTEMGICAWTLQIILLLNY